MRLPCSFTAVSLIAALCGWHSELSFISMTTNKQKSMEAGSKSAKIFFCCQGIVMANFKTTEE